MTIYYAAYAVMCFIAAVIHYETDNDKRRNNVICTVGFFSFFLILALRHWSMGVDLGYYSLSDSGYMHSFDNLNKYSWSEILKMKSFLNYEKGYVIFNKLIGSIWNNRQFFLGVCAFINISVVSIFICKRSKLPLMSWVVFLGLPSFLMFFSGLRQAIAISITMIAVRWIERKKIIPFVLTVLLSWTFHSSAIVFLLAYPLYYVRLTDVQKMLFALLIPVIYVFKVPLFMVLNKLFKNNAVVENTGAGMLFIVFFCIYLFLVISHSYQKKQQSGYINLFYMACICQAFGGVYDTAMRVGYYFMVYLVVALPNTIEDFKNTERGTGRRDFMLSYTLIFIAFALFGLYSIANGSWSCTNPYVFFWQMPMT